MADSYEEEIKQKMDALPASVRDYIYSSDMDASIRAIGAKHQLHIDQIGALTTESVAVMIGLSDAKDFVSELADSLNINTEKATAITEDVNKEVFVKIREAMKKGPPAASAPKVSPPPVQTPPAANPIKISTPPPPASPKATQGTASPPPLPSVALPRPPVALSGGGAKEGPKPAEAHPADLMLTQKTVTVAPVKPTTNNLQPTTNNQLPKTETPATPPKLQPYKTDPYREPPVG